MKSSLHGLEGLPLAVVVSPRAVSVYCQSVVGKSDRMIHHAGIDVNMFT